MGTNAIPFLLDDLDCKDSKVEPRASHLMHLKTVRSILPRKWYYSIDQIFLLKRMEPFKNRMRGVMGFWALGTNASPAYPKLIELTKSSDRDDRFWGFVGFATSRPPEELFVPVVLRLIKDPDEEIRTTAATALQGLYPKNMEKYKIYDSFPDLRPGQTNVIQIPSTPVGETN